MKQPKGIFVLVAGSNAAGKSTVINPSYVDNRIKHRLDPDRILAISKDDILTEKTLAFYATNQAEKFAVNCLQDWFASERICSEGIATESNLVSKRDFRIFKEAKRSEMQTELHFVGIPIEIAIQREQIRTNAGEQEKIPEDTIRDRHSKELFNIQKHIDSGNIDKIMIYDNSRGKGEEQLLLHIENGKTLYLHPELPQWFLDAEIHIPPVLAQ